MANASAVILCVAVAVVYPKINVLVFGLYAGPLPPPLNPPFCPRTEPVHAPTVGVNTFSDVI